MRVVATAGHVDHGKSSLVLALTGTDPDRFAEEKARGLTIDLGFAFTALPSGTSLAFVDVPGHVRFVKNMLAGVGAVEAALFVVAANEGWMPQSEEHLRILELLGVEHAVVALTKAALVDGDMLELAHLEVEERLDASPLRNAPIVECDAKTGAGLDALRAALDTMLRDAPLAADRNRPRLWIDRVFAARGAGTVVTGTLAGGSLAVDDEMQLWPGRRKVRVRGLESNHEQLERVGPGRRVAVNLAGVEHHEVQRGDALVRAGQWVTARACDVELHLLPGTEMARRGGYKAYAGSGEYDVRVRVLDAGGQFARVHFARPLPLAPGDRFVLRESGRQITAGGALVLDVAPVGRAGLAASRLALPLGPRLLAARPWLAVAELGARAGTDDAGAGALAADLETQGLAVMLGEWVVARRALDALREQCAALAAAHHARSPLEAGIEVNTLAAQLHVSPAQLRAALTGATGLVVDHGRVRLDSHRPAPANDPAAQSLLAALRAEPFSPPTPADLGASPALVSALVRSGDVVDLDGVVFAADALHAARARVVDHLRTEGTITVAGARDLLGSSRKFVLAILTYLDGQGVTRRRGDERIAGPRAGIAGT